MLNEMEKKYYLDLSRPLLFLFVPRSLGPHHDGSIGTRENEAPTVDLKHAKTCYYFTRPFLLKFIVLNKKHLNNKVNERNLTSLL